MSIPAPREAFAVNASRNVSFVAKLKFPFFRRIRTHTQVRAYLYFRYLYEFGTITRAKEQGEVPDPKSTP